MPAPPAPLLRRRRELISERWAMRGDRGRYVGTEDAPAMCECQRAISDCDCAQIFGAR